MKKVLLKAVPLLLVVALLCSLLIFYGVTLNRDDGLNITETDLARSASISGSTGCKAAFDGSKMTSWSFAGSGKEVVIDFGDEQQINALLLNEVGFNVKQFSIYVDNDGEWELKYRQNEIGINRLATFYTVSTSKIKITFDDVKNVVSISDVKVFNLRQRQREEELRVTSYITPGALRNGLIDPDCFDVVTDVQLIAYGRFDGQGNIEDGVYDDGYGKRADAELAILRELIAGRDVNIYLTIFPPLSPDNMADVLRNNMDNAVQSVVERVLATGADGADFDWEYPANAEEYRLYSDFLVRLKTELSKYDKKLSVALSPWNVQLTQEAVDAIDLLQVMAYDLFDHNGDNNSYAGSVDSAVRYMLNRGFKASQIFLGISYYGRPSDGKGEWYNYNDPAFTPDEFIMFQNNVWFNTPTTVRDKTVYAILKGLGGIMTFAQDEDVAMTHELSLTAQIGKAREAFSEVVYE
ncbi:MAG: glycosyl hydrolase family 18 protein [Christensenellales bacterium]